MKDLMTYLNLEELLAGMAHTHWTPNDETTNNEYD